MLRHRPISKAGCYTGQALLRESIYVAFPDLTGLPRQNTRAAPDQRAWEKGEADAKSV